jgi:hypothetical protein
VDQVGRALVAAGWRPGPSPIMRSLPLWGESEGREAHDRREEGVKESTESVVFVGVVFVVLVRGVRRVAALSG